MGAASLKSSKSITEEAFARLGKEKLMQEYSEIIFKLTGLVIDFISAEGVTRLVSHGTNFNPFCALMQSCKGGAEACVQCDIDNASAAAELKKPVCYTCHGGLHEIVVPVYDENGNYLGCLTSGQFHLSNAPYLSKESIYNMAEKYGIDADELYNSYKSSNSLTQTQVEGIIAYLNIISHHLTGIREHLIFMEKINVPDIISEVKKYIDEHFDANVSIKQIAERFHISPSNLAHKFKENTNVSFQRYINFRRFTKAKEMLQETTLSISEIAYACGFGSISQFNRNFRSASGISPSEYRKNIKSAPKTENAHCSAKNA